MEVVGEDGSTSSMAMASDHLKRCRVAVTGIQFQIDDPLKTKLSPTDESHYDDDDDDGSGDFSKTRMEESEETTGREKRNLLLPVSGFRESCSGAGYWPSSSSHVRNINQIQTPEADPGQGGDSAEKGERNSQTYRSVDETSPTGSTLPYFLSEDVPPPRLSARLAEKCRQKPPSRVRVYSHQYSTDAGQEGGGGEGGGGGGDRGDPTVNLEEGLKSWSMSEKPSSRLYSPSESDARPPGTPGKTMAENRRESGSSRPMASYGISGVHSRRHFRLTDDCQLVLQRGDLTKWHVDGESDAIVNAANERMLGGGGVDGAIHRAAGPGLVEQCRSFPEVRKGVRCPTGSARVTRGCRLPVSRVVHTVGPIYVSSRISAPILLSAYRSSIEAAEHFEIKYLAFPAISCGIFGYPYDEAAKLALQACKEYPRTLKEIHFVLFEQPAWDAWLNEAERHLLRAQKTNAEFHRRKHPALSETRSDEHHAVLSGASRDEGHALSEVCRDERSGMGREERRAFSEVRGDERAEIGGDERSASSGVSRRDEKPAA